MARRRKRATELRPPWGDLPDSENRMGYAPRVKRLFANVDWMQVGGLFVLASIILWLWGTGVVYPLKVLVVFFHEMSHGLAALVTGGEVHGIELSERIGGLASTQGGNRFFTASAGYLGSLIIGASILLLSSRTRFSKVIAVSLGAVLLGATLWLVRPVVGFGFIFGLVVALLFIAAGLFLHKDTNEFVLRIVGLTSCLYVVHDIKSDILDRPELKSDARTIAELTGVPTLVWGVLWLVTALVVGGLFVVLACKKNKRDGGPLESRAPRPARPSA